MKIITYKQAVTYLESFIGKVIFRVDPKFLKHHDPLERMRIFLSLLGNPQEKFKSVLVGGTSGKGSTAYLISHIFKTAGYKTGLTISPHLQKINERLQINGEPISDQKFTDLLASILSSIGGMKKMPIGSPSYFEILVGMAFKYFADQKVDIAVVEVGMGGEFDATNTLYPLVSVLTNVSLDHTNVLGGTVQKIARTKAGIIKGFSSCHPECISGSPARRQVFLQPNEMLKQVQHDKKKKPIVVTGVKQPSVIKIVEDRCKEVGVIFLRLGKDFDFKIKKESLRGSVFDLTINNDRVSQLNNLELSLLGKYQVENASLAIETVLRLEKFGFKVSEEQIRTALETASFPGRFEVLKCHPEFISGSEMLKQDGYQTVNRQVQHDKEKTIILDGAHNPTKMKAFTYSLKKLYRRERKIFVIGFKFDKDIPKMLKQIVRVADEIIVTEFHAKTDIAVSGSAGAFNIRHQILNIKNGTKVMVEKDSKKALALALNYPITQLPNYQSIIVVTGSLYLVGEIKSML